MDSTLSVLIVLHYFAKNIRIDLRVEIDMIEFLHGHNTSQPTCAPAHRHARDAQALRGAVLHLARTARPTGSPRTGHAASPAPQLGHHPRGPITQPLQRPHPKTIRPTSHHRGPTTPRPSLITLPNSPRPAQRPEEVFRGFGTERQNLFSQIGGTVNSKSVPLVVTTEHKGVFFGYGNPTAENTVPA